MGHLPSLIQDLALILIAAAITTLLFKKIKQPIILGYIIAGFLVGPFLSLTPTVVDHANVKTLADIGVIFLLFGLGLEFSFKKLARVGGASSIIALVEIAFITGTGYYLGRWMGWSLMDSLFLGGMLAGSSTIIIIKVFDELGIKTKQYARVAFGVLIIQDIVVIMLMVLLSTVAITKQFEGSDMLFIVGKLIFFLVLWFLAGIFLLPTLLNKAKEFLDEETLLILSIGLCLGMVVIATLTGFSAELGAFIMGSLLAETTKAEKIEHVLKPVKDLFGAIFFVSVGMLIDPELIVAYKWPVLWVTLLTLFGKLFITIIGALLAGQPLKQSVQLGMSMAQIGEFAFIVAALGLSLGVISDFLFPVAVGVSAITTFTTPYMVKFSPKFYEYIEKILPDNWVKRLNRYSANIQLIQAESDWKKVLKSYLSIALINGIIILALIILTTNLFIPFLHSIFNDTLTVSVLGLIVSFGIATPFLWALMAKKPNSIAYKGLWLNNKYNKGPLLIIEISRNLLGFALILFWINQFFTTLIFLLLIFPIILILLFFFSKSIQRFYQRLEGRFLNNLNARESREKLLNNANNTYSRNPQTNLSPWDAHIVDLAVNPHADYIGKKLVTLAWREKYGINIAYIKRGDFIIYAPGRDNRLLPFDHAGIIATDDQIHFFKPIFDAEESLANDDEPIEDFILQKIVVDEHNQLKGHTIRESGIRERTNGLVVGIERNMERQLNPESSFLFEWGDIVWIVGDRKKIQQLNIR